VVNQVFDGKKPAKLGTETRPAKVSVQTEQRKAELEAIFERNGWKHEITVDANKPENTFDLDQLLNPIAPAKAAPKVGRNEPCPCGSGKKYKKCCGR
jgi:SWIM/SEC-C metal-binding protein